MGASASGPWDVGPWVVAADSQRARPGSEGRCWCQREPSEAWASSFSHAEIVRGWEKDICHLKVMVAHQGSHRSSAQAAGRARVLKK